MKISNYKIFILALGFVTISIFNLSSSNHKQLHSLGDTVIVSNCSNELILTSSASIDNLVLDTIRGIIYSYGVTGLSGNPLLNPNNNDTVIIKYIDATDKKFITPEGVKIGMTLSRVKQFTKSKLQCESGWAYYIKLPSGWNAAFLPENNNWDRNKNLISDNSKVVFIFKR